MATDRSGDTFALVPAAWLDPVLGAWVLVLGAGGIVVTLGVGRRVIAPLAAAPAPAVLLTTLLGAIAYGVFGLGTAYAYLTYRDLAPGFVVEPVDRDEWRSLLGLGVGALAVMLVAGTISGLAGGEFAIGGQPITVGSLPTPAGWSAITLGLAGVNELVNQAPVVLLIAVLAGVIVGPAIALLVHGVLQPSLAGVARRSLVIAVTAIAAGALTEPSAFGGVVTTHEAVGGGSTIAFAVLVAYAYDASGNLAVPMAAYAVFNVFAVVGGWLSLLARLYLALGHF